MTKPGKNQVGGDTRQITHYIFWVFENFYPVDLICLLPLFKLAVQTLNQKQFIEYAEICVKWPFLQWSSNFLLQS